MKVFGFVEIGNHVINLEQILDITAAPERGGRYVNLARERSILLTEAEARELLEEIRWREEEIAAADTYELAESAA